MTQQINIFISSVQKEFSEDRLALRDPHPSIRGNPLLAEPLYLTKYIERMGTGTGDMIRECRKAGLPEPQFSVLDGFFVTTIWRKLGVGTQEATGEVPGKYRGSRATGIGDSRGNETS